MTSYSQTDTFSISTIQSLILHSLLTSSHLNCFSFSPCSPDALHPPPPTHPRTTHTSIRQVLPTPVMTLQRQSSPALLSPPLHHSVHPRKTLRPYFSWSCSSASLSPTLSLSCFMAVDLLPEHLASRVREREDTHTHTQTTHGLKLGDKNLGAWWGEDGVWGCKSALLYFLSTWCPHSIMKSSDDSSLLRLVLHLTRFILGI